MPVVKEEEKQIENEKLAGGGCCGGAGQAATDKEQNQTVSKNLEVKVEKKEKEQGSSCCG